MSARLILRVVVLAVTFCLSAFFSGSETALFSLPPEESHTGKSASRPERAIASLLSHPRRLLTTILLGNMVVNVLFYCVSFILIYEYREVVGRTGSLALGLVSLLTVIVFCEVMPKNIAVRLARPWSRFAAVPILVVQRVFFPIVLLLDKLNEGIASLLGRHARPEPLIRSEELQMLVDLSEREGVLDVDVSGMIAGVMELSDIPLREVMVPRVQMVAFDVEDPPEELLQLFCSEKCTFIPLYENKVDNVLGVVHVKDLFLKAEEKDLRSLIRPVPFIPETASAEDALKRFRAEHAKMALAVDEYGAVQGLVTIEDVLEEVVGEITDEYDEAESPPVESLGPRKYRLRGELNIREWEELFSMQLPRMPVDTIGGLVTALLDRVPHEGDSAEYGNLKFTVETIRGRRVETVILELDRSDEDEEGENAGTG